MANLVCATDLSQTPKDTAPKVLGTFVISSLMALGAAAGLFNQAVMHLNYFLPARLSITWFAGTFLVLGLIVSYTMLINAHRDLRLMAVMGVAVPVGLVGLGGLVSNSQFGQELFLTCSFMMAIMGVDVPVGLVGLSGLVSNSRFGQELFLTCSFMIIALLVIRVFIEELLVKKFVTKRESAETAKPLLD